jgi:ribonuclease E
MLIDATHAEETRVVVLDGNRLEDFDVETSTKKQLKGNIYLAKVVRVEPSLQAAFVEYGGGRHGFLAFGEIHPDYYQIPVADRQRLLEIAAEEAREEEEAEDRRAAGWAVRTPQPEIAHDVRGPEPAAEAETVDHAEPVAHAEPEALHETQEATPEHHEPEAHAPELHAEPAAHDEPDESREGPAQPALMPAETIYGDAPQPELGFDEAPGLPPNVSYAGDAEGVVDEPGDDIVEITVDDAPPPETIGGESDQFEGNGAEEASRRRASRMLRSYRIQEVIRRRQILLIQVVKEERGNKGAALTTYISLAGRYCVLMPNSPRGGGISRKITSASDRKRLKEITAEMEIPKGMGLIVRTAGAARPKPEIKRDCEYLMRLWDDIRDHTMASMAPALIYEEASLIKRSIRDVYSRDVDEIIVDGEAGWKQAHDFMRMLMPSHAKKVQLWRPQGIATPLFAKYQVDLQLDAMLAPTVQLKSGGYLVINQTEALVAVDVNSGRSTRERGIEETALKTNLEAADELARQLRLRDLAGLIVIDFIDMEARKANAMVERRMKEALKNDRARIQLGAISHFGLMEMSRQRLRPSLAETSFVACPHCNGLGHVRSVESAAIHVLRAVEEEGSKLRAAAILVHAAGPVVMYILNNKRDRLTEIEARYAMRVSFATDDTLLPPAVRVDRLRAQVPEAERLLAATPIASAPPPVIDDADEEEEEADLVFDEAPAEARVSQPRDSALRQATPAAPTGEVSTEESEQRKRRRRRRRGGRRDGAPGSETAAPGTAEQEAGEEAEDSVTAGTDGELTALVTTDAAATGGEIPVGETPELDENGEPKARRRGRRGGRRRRRPDGSEIVEEASAEGEAVEPVAAAPVSSGYAGPTPADPFNNTYDIFDILEQAEEAAAQAPTVRQVPIQAHPPTPAEPLVEVAAAPGAEPHVAASAEPSVEPSVAPSVAPIMEDHEIVVLEAEPEPTPEPVASTEPPPPAKRGWWRR